MIVTALQLLPIFFSVKEKLHGLLRSPTNFTEKSFEDVSQGLLLAAPLSASLSHLPSLLPLSPSLSPPSLTFPPSSLSHLPSLLPLSPSLPPPPSLTFPPSSLSHLPPLLTLSPSLPPPFHPLDCSHWCRISGVGHEEHQEPQRGV